LRATFFHEKKLNINFDKKWVWLHTGQFFSQARLVALISTSPFIFDKTEEQTDGHGKQCDSIRTHDFGEN
jgi:hypothetical protein